MSTTLYTVDPVTRFSAAGYDIVQAGTVVPDGVVWAIQSAAAGAGVTLNTSAGGAPQLVQVPSYYNGGTGAPVGDVLPVGAEVKDSTGAVYEKTPGGWVGGASGVSALVPTAVKTTAYTAAVGDLIPVDTTSGAVTVTLPAAPADKAQVAVKHIIQGSANAVTIARGGSSDVFNKAGGSTSLSLTTANQAMTLQYKASSGIWYVLSDSLSLTALNGTFALSGVPSYATPRTNRFDVIRSGYNFKPSNTRRLKASLAKATAGTALAHHVAIGDSETSGYNGVSGDSLGAWPREYGRVLAALGIPSGGAGSVQIADASGVNDPRWTVTGTWSQSNQYRAANAIGNTATFSTVASGSYAGESGRFFRLSTFGSSTPFTYSVDGGAVTGTITPTGGSVPYATVIDCLTNATHSSVLTTTSASAAYIVSGSLYGTSGLLVHNLGRFGSTAAGSGQGAWVDNGSFINTYNARVGSLPTTTPDVVFIALGVNDKGASTSDATTTAAISTIAARFPSSDIILVAQYQPGGQLLSTWQSFTASLYTLADTLDVPLLDLFDRSGGYTTANANGLMGDATHPNSPALRDWGRAAALLAAA